MLREKLDEVHLPVSKAKSRVLASCPHLRKDLARDPRRQKGLAVQSERNLGIDYAAGGVIKRLTRRTRRAAARARHSKLL
eukprot:3148203-Pyramimonas_sp.AAC.1